MKVRLDFIIFWVMTILLCLIFWGMVFCSLVRACDYCVEHPGEKEIQTNGMGARGRTEPLQKDHLVLVRRINDIGKDIEDIQDTLKKLYSLIADLHMKEMGVDRYEQIAFPDSYIERWEFRHHKKWPGR